MGISPTVDGGEGGNGAEPAEGQAAGRPGGGSTPAGAELEVYADQGGLRPGGQTVAPFLPMPAIGAEQETPQMEKGLMEKENHSKETPVGAVGPENDPDARRTRRSVLAHVEINMERVGGAADVMEPETE